VDDWTNGEGYYKRAKGWSWRKIPSEVQSQLTESLGNWVGWRGKGFYPRTETPPVTANSTTIQSYTHENRITATRDGSVAWHFLAGGRSMVAPVTSDDLVYVGCNDGWVYALKISDGSVVWQYHAAPAERRMVGFGQVESAWPVVGLTRYENTVLFVAGRRDTYDDGITVGALDLKTGELQWQENLWREQVVYTSPQEAQQAGFGGWGAEHATLASSAIDDGQGRLFLLGTSPLSPDLQFNPLRPVSVDQSKLEKGIKYRYFEYDSIVTEKISTEGLSPTAEGVADSLFVRFKNNSWEPYRYRPMIEGLPRTADSKTTLSYTLNYMGLLKIEKAGKYQFELKSREYGDLYLANRLLISAESSYGGMSQELQLEEGFYPIYCSYQCNEDVSLNVSWRNRTSEAFQGIAGSQLYHDPSEDFDFKPVLAVNEKAVPLPPSALKVKRIGARYYVTVTVQEPHSFRMMTMNGKTVSLTKGDKPGTYSVLATAMPTGAYVMEISLPKRGVRHAYSMVHMK